MLTRQTVEHHSSARTVSARTHLARRRRVPYETKKQTPHWFRTPGRAVHPFKRVLSSSTAS